MCQLWWWFRALILCKTYKKCLNHVSWFSNDTLQHEFESEQELTAVASSLHSNMKWAIFMASAGHFAAAVFHDDKMVAHKTFHRYVVRAKRGTAQSQRDKQGNAPKSAGASIRRANEAALTQVRFVILENFMTWWMTWEVLDYVNYVINNKVLTVNLLVQMRILKSLFQMCQLRWWFRAYSLTSSVRYVKLKSSKRMRTVHIPHYQRSKG